ncbi:hypothetical protein Ancab_004906 [Ancistrocladus abbreviatus]
MRSNGRQRLNELLYARLLKNASEIGKEEKVHKYNKWPGDMDMLTNLRHLDLTQAKLDIFPAECISSYNQMEELLMLWDINSKGYVQGSNELGDWNGAHVEWLPYLRHLADLQLVFLNAMVFNSYMNACPNTADGYAIATTCFKFVVGDFHSAGVKSNSHENSITVIGDHCMVLPKSTLVLNLMNCPDDRVHDGEVLNCENLTRIRVWRCGLLRLPELLGVRGDNVLEIGEREWCDAFQQHNPGFFDRCPVRFMEAPVPPEVLDELDCGEMTAI